MTFLVVCCFVFLRFCFLHRRHYRHFSLPSLLYWKKNNLLCENHCTYLWWKYFWKSRMMPVSTRSWSAWLWSAGNKLWTFHKTELDLGSLGIWTDTGTWDCQWILWLSSYGPQRYVSHYKYKNELDYSNINLNAVTFPLAWGYLWTQQKWPDLMPPAELTAFIPLILCFLSLA